MRDKVLKLKQLHKINQSLNEKVATMKTRTCHSREPLGASITELQKTI